MRDEHVYGGDTSADQVSNWSKLRDKLYELSEIRSTESKRWDCQSIYKIPWSMKELRRRAYEPQIVSIGPYHHGKQELEAMEGHKQRALLTFLERTKKTLDYYLHRVAPMVEDLKNAYDQLEDKWKQDNKAFLELMIVDGCFILEIMRTAIVSPAALSKMGYARNDPVFSFEGKFTFITDLMCDMLKLENQLPLLLLVKLLLAEEGSLASVLSKKDELARLIVEFLGRRRLKFMPQEYRHCSHILDLYRKTLVLTLPFERKEHSYHREDDYFLSATKLIESGIRFKQSNTFRVNNIRFRGGVLTLPPVFVDETTESDYLNMMAFERFHLREGQWVRSYVLFMSKIIYSASDARILVSRGIIYNRLGSDKDVANLFISLAREVRVYPDSRLEAVHKDISDYCRRPGRRCMVYAKHKYFTNIWVALSVLAAILLFALTGLQTVYTVLGYYNPKKEN